jgi:molybdopterin-dependent oxidoreductase alpha subunit
MPFPFGLGRQKPHHYLEMVRVAWQNRDEWPFAWRILRDGVCDGCALGTSGLSDWTIPGTHLCMVRLELMRLNTAPALDPALLSDVSRLEALTGTELRALGRLPVPLVRRRGERGFTAVSWDEALDCIAATLRCVAPDRLAFYLTSRGITNETYYAAQKTARCLGTNNVDNAARLCHAASTVAMKQSLGHGASTCSYVDWLDADLIVLCGSNTPNNQPVTMKYLHYARARGAEIAVVNPFREPGLERYWVPSIASSAVFGTELATHWYGVDTGGDLAFLTGVLRALLELDGVDRAFVDRCTSGAEAAFDAARQCGWERLEALSGATRQSMTEFAQLLSRRQKVIFVWSMGLTQHAHGVDTVRALLNVALARGLFGRPGCGVMPIRGHSGVQGGAEMGCLPNLDDPTRHRYQDVWGFPVPAAPGLSADEMVTRAADGGIDLFWMVGGNFLDTLPDRDRSRRALARPGLRIHQDIVLTTAMLVEPSSDVVLLPATTRYESPGGVTETSTERRIIFSPEIPGRRIGDARPEWQVFGDVLARARATAPQRFADAASIRAEISRAVPLYAGIDTLKEKGDQVQWGGQRLFDDLRFATPDGRARFSVVELRAGRPLTSTGVPPTSMRFRLSTRRGKQFNSIVQRETDPLTGAARDAVLMNAVDASRLGIETGDAVEVRSAAGTFRGRAQLAPIRAGNLAVHWPEGNSLLSAGDLDPESKEPDYNTVVWIAATGGAKS